MPSVCRKNKMVGRRRTDTVRKTPCFPPNPPWSSFKRGGALCNAQRTRSHDMHYISLKPHLHHAYALAVGMHTAGRPTTQCSRTIAGKSRWFFFLFVTSDTPSFKLEYVQVKVLAQFIVLNNAWHAPLFFLSSRLITKLVGVGTVGAGLRRDAYFGRERMPCIRGACARAEKAWDDWRSMIDDQRFLN